jgi:hypothetical protein
VQRGADVKGRRTSSHLRGLTRASTATSRKEEIEHCCLIYNGSRSSRYTVPPLRNLQSSEREMSAERIRCQECSLQGFRYAPSYSDKEVTIDVGREQPLSLANEAPAPPLQSSRCSRSSTWGRRRCQAQSPDEQFSARREGRGKSYSGQTRTVPVVFRAWIDLYIDFAFLWL